MQLGYFAGTVFTAQDMFVFGAVAFVAISALAGVVIFFGGMLLSKVITHNTRYAIRFSRATLLGYAIIGAAILLFLVLPTMAKDSIWRHKQQSCAKEVGYTDPSEDDSSSATSESQTAYRSCLDR